MTDVEYVLEDRMGERRSTVALSGVQALLRVPLDQVREDRRLGARTAALVAGYRGSPLGGVDSAYWRDAAAFEAEGVRFLDGINEEMAATAIWGTQTAAADPACTHDGVLGLWYGKGPGLDRAGDAIRHANISGVAPTGGVLAAVGDDPACKSSTIPSASEGALADLALPALYPGSVQEVLDLGRHAYALSRWAGAWVGMKIHTEVADAYATVDVDPGRLSIVTGTALHAAAVDAGLPRGWRPSRGDALLAPLSVDLEAEAYGARLDAVRAYAAVNDLDRIFGAGDGRSARVGIVAAGRPYHDLIDALVGLSITPADLADLRIRIHRPGLIWPVEPTRLRRFAAGLDEILVVEAKRPFLEAQVRDLCYGMTDAPPVVGRRDHEGRPLIPAAGDIGADELTEPLRRWLGRHLPADRLRPPRSRTRIRIPLTVGDTTIPAPETVPFPASGAVPFPASGAVSAPAEGDAFPTRTPYFCSGCPHNRSTLVPDGSVVGGGIGCHAMALMMDGRAVGVTQMGGEGAQWVGASMFLDEPHRFQNIGDGTLAHSGTLAIRQAVAAGTTVTFKVLYNGAVAMTGGQAAAGDRGVPALTRALEAEGAVRIDVVTDDPDAYPDDEPFASGVTVHHRDRLDEVQRELREVSGVTVLVYDQACAAELRRARKRGTLPTPTTRAFINEAVCDGCGHCGVVSNCTSVQPVETPLGRRTRIHQGSCNVDLTCVEGDCPAFLTVEVDPESPAPSSFGEPARSRSFPPVDGPTSGNVLLCGIGGTGIVTAAQVLTTAALLDGREASTLDQTGMAQKGGPVVSHVRIGPGASAAGRLPDGGVDTLLVADLLTGTDPANLARCDPDRTAAVVSTSLVPTGAQVAGRAAEHLPALAHYRRLLDRYTDVDRGRWIDAEGVAGRELGAPAAANIVLLGAALQLGLLPVSADAIEQAITLNGVAVDINLAALDLGRALVADPAERGRPGNDPADRRDRPLAPPARDRTVERLLARVDTEGRPDLAEALAWRIPELIGWGGRRHARRYVDLVARMAEAERRVMGRGPAAATTATATTAVATAAATTAVATAAATTAVAVQAAKLMTYKDEYEVARLHLRRELRSDVERDLGAGVRITYQLRPPSLSRFGLDAKIGVGERPARAMFALLVRLRRLRGTPVDPFGRTAERRIERQLIGDYEALVDAVVAGLTPANHRAAVMLLEAADVIRGFGDVKLANVERYEATLVDAIRAFEQLPGSVPPPAPSPAR